MLLLLVALDAKLKHETSDSQSIVNASKVEWVILKELVVKKVFEVFSYFEYLLLEVDDMF